MDNCPTGHLAGEPSHAWNPPLSVIGGYWRLLAVIGGYWRLLAVIVAIGQWTDGPRAMVNDHCPKDQRNWTDEEHEHGNSKDGHFVVNRHWSGLS